MTMYNNRNSSCVICHATPCHVTRIDVQLILNEREPTERVRYVEHPCCCEMFFTLFFFSLIFLVFFVPHLYLYAVKFVSVLYALFIYCLFVVLAFPIKCNLVCIYIFMFVSANWNYWKGSKCIIHRTLLTRIHFVFTKWPNQRIFFSLDLARVRKNIFACVS